MWFKEVLKKTFKDDKKIVFERYKAAKFVFIISSFLFFLNFYFVGARFYIGIFNYTLAFMYVVLLLSIMFYIYYYIKKMLIDKLPAFVFILLLFILFAGFLFLVLPAAIEDGVEWVLKLI